MKFGEIIREAGIDPTDVPKTSKVPIILYDSKGRDISDTPLQFEEPIFEKNPTSHTKFSDFLAGVETKLVRGNTFGSSPIVFAQLTEFTLTVSIPPEAPHIFIR